MSARTQVCCVSSVLGAALLAAAVDSGTLAPAQRRILLVSNAAEVPELVTPPHAVPGFEALARRFDEVLDWNELIAPLHPAGWYPPAPELPLISRLLRRKLGLDGAVELVVDGLAAPPASSIVALLPDCPVTVLSDSLLAWGPPTKALTSEQAGRATGLLHLPVLAGLRPLLLADASSSPDCTPVPAHHLRAVLAELPAVTVSDDAVLLVGTRPGGSDTGPVELLRAVAAHGRRKVVLVPHPTDVVEDRALHGVADGLGVTLIVTTDGLPAEAVLARSRPALVVGGVGPTLVLAREVFGLPVAAVGVERVLAAGGTGSERVPATIVHATLPALGGDGTCTEPPPLPGSLAALVDAVAYSLAPDVLLPLRAAAVDHLAAHGGGPYVDHARLLALGLAGEDRSARLRARIPRTSVRRLARALRR